MRNDAREVMQNRLSEKQDVPQVFYGFIGNPDGVVNVPGRQNYVYVTLADGLVTQAYNVICPMIYNLPVICGYDQNQKSSGLLKVLGVRNLPRAKPQTTSTVEHHHASHEWMNPNGNTDVVYTELRQFMPLRPTPVAPYSIRINRGVLKIGTDWKVVGGVTVDLTSHIPFTTTTSGSGYLMAKYVLVSISGASGSPVVTDGSVLSAYSIGLPNIPATPAGHYPICAVQLYAGQTKIDETYSKTDLIDLRWGMFANSQILPKATAPVANFYLTGYDAVSGSFSSGSVAGNHNTLTGLQGGVANEYYHLTAAQQVIATQAAGSGASGYLTKTDWNRFNATSGSAGISDAPTDGKQYGRQNAMWTEIVSGSGGTSGSSGIPLSGWCDIATALAYLTADAPTYYLTTSTDLTGSLSVGMKLKFTQAGSSVYGFVTAISGSSITMYCGTDYAVSGSAITAPAFSTQKAPYGFPIDPAKWTVKFTDTTLRTQATPTAQTWYNIGSLSVSVPIGVWNLRTKWSTRASDSSSISMDLFVALSTSGSGVSDTEMSAEILYSSLTRNQPLFTITNQITLTSKTNFYPIAMIYDSGLDNLYFLNSNTTMVIAFTCAYL